MLNLTRFTLRHSIDIVSHRIAEKLKKLKGKSKSQESGLGVAGAAVINSENSKLTENQLDLERKYKKDLGDDPNQWSTNFLNVVKTKKFNMPAISVQEALVCLDMIDHPFYVFRNKDTNEINVVYKRVGEGAGLIQPEDAV